MCRHGQSPAPARTEVGRTPGPVPGRFPCPCPRSRGAGESQGPAECPPSVRRRRRSGGSPRQAPAPTAGADLGGNKRRKVNTDDDPGRLVGAGASRGKPRGNLRRKNPKGNPNLDQDHGGDGRVLPALGEGEEGVGQSLEKNANDLGHGLTGQGRGRDLTSPRGVLYRPSHNVRGAGAGLGHVGDSQDVLVHDFLQSLLWS